MILNKSLNFSQIICSLTRIKISAFTFYASSILFAVFGLKMLHEGYHMSATEGQEEFEEVNEELRKREEKEGRGDVEAGGRRETTAAALLSKAVCNNCDDLAVKTR